MEFIKTFFSNNQVVTNLVVLVGVLVLIGLSFVFGSRYNAGRSKANLILARVTVVLASVLVIVWIVQ